ncbi:MAG: polysaccharide pyruvyl transferase family protein [Lachnospiraceae bacterium]
MKVAIITRHAICNYGSFLQTYALQKEIDKLGHEAVIIDYIREDEEYHKRINVALKKSGKWNKNVPTRLVYKLSRYPETVFMEKKFASFRNNLLHMTKLYTSLEELKQDKPQADVFCTGSDQVWDQSVWIVMIQHISWILQRNRIQGLHMLPALVKRNLMKNPDTFINKLFKNMM